MLGEILYEEKGKTTGVRVLTSEGDDVRVEVSLSARLSKLNGTVGVHEYDVDAEGNTVAKIWEWK